MIRREIEICVISDLHLGSRFCKSSELLQYLRSIEPKTIILNGDVFDVISNHKTHLPKIQLDIIADIVEKSLRGTKVYYLAPRQTHNRFALHLLSRGNITYRSHLELRFYNHKYLIFPGKDIRSTNGHRIGLFSILHKGQYLLRNTRNQLIKILDPRGNDNSIPSNPSKLSKQYIKRFEQKVVQYASEHDYDYVICGHVHKPYILRPSSNHQCTYMNAGDWIEHLSALEFVNDQWRIYRYDPAEFDIVNPKLTIKSSVFRQKSASIVLPKINSSAILKQD